jgi:hypothetical protein
MVRDMLPYLQQGCGSWVYHHHVGSRHSSGGSAERLLLVREHGHMAVSLPSEGLQPRYARDRNGLKACNLLDTSAHLVTASSSPSFQQCERIILVPQSPHLGYFKEKGNSSWDAGILFYLRPRLLLWEATCPCEYTDFTELSCTTVNKSNLPRPRLAEPLGP